MKSHAFFLLVAGTLGGAAPASAADDPFLSQLVGNWIGRGAMIQNADAKPERVYCKITNTLADNGASLLQEGRCSLASNSGPIKGKISFAGDGAYAGTLENPAAKGPVRLNGTLATMTKDPEGRIVPAEKTTKPEEKIEALQMDTVYVDRLSDSEVRSVNTIAVQPTGGYTLLATRVNPATGETYTSSRIDFTAE